MRWARPHLGLGLAIDGQMGEQGHAPLGHRAGAAILEGSRQKPAENPLQILGRDGFVDDPDPEEGRVARDVGPGFSGQDDARDGFAEHLAGALVV